VGADAEDAVLLQLTRDNNSLSGSIAITELPASATQTLQFNRAFTGTVDGEAVTLTFDQGLGLTTSRGR
jgi:hypothetical protein